MQNIIYSAKYLWRRYYGLTVAQVSLPVLVLTAFKLMNSTQLCGLSPFSLTFWFLKDSFVGSGGGSFFFLVCVCVCVFGGWGHGVGGRYCRQEVGKT